MHVTRLSDGHPQLDPVVRRVDQILLRAQVPLCRLHGCVAKEQLDLFKLTTGGATEFGSRAAAIMRRNPRDTGSLSVRPEHLPDHLFAEHVAAHLVAANDGAEHVSVRDAGGGGPGIDRHLHPDRHRNGRHAPVFSVEIDDAPPAISLLDVVHRKGGDLGPAQRAAEQHGDDGAVTQALERRDIRRVKERLGLFER